MEQNPRNPIEEKDFLASYHQGDYDRPSLATDMVVFTINNKEAKDYRKLSQKELSVLLIKRGEHPFMNYWALPGGFVRKEETVEAAAYRELLEEAGVSDIFLSQLHCFSEPKRDPRGWVISFSFMALAEVEQFHLSSSNDALDAKWFHIQYNLIDMKSEDDAIGKLVKRQYQLQLNHEDINLTALIEIRDYLSLKRKKTEYVILESEGIAFDHAKILSYAISQLRDNLDTSLLAFELLPEYFTLTDLQHVYETILGENLLTSNFRRKTADYVVETDQRLEGFGHRPSKLYKRNMDMLI